MSTITDSLAPLRKECIKKLTELFYTNAKLDKQESIQLSKSLESNLLRASYKQCQEYGEEADHSLENIYIDNVRCLLINCDPESYVKNYELIQLLCTKSINPKLVSQYVTEMPYALFRGKNQEIIDYIEKQENTTYNHEIIGDSQFKCRKCKKRKCNVTLAQLRSADEPMSVLITCRNCGHNWRIG